MIGNVFYEFEDDYKFLLKEYGFVHSEGENSEYFGNSYTVLSSDGLHIKMVKDRDSYYVDITHDPKTDEWFDVGLLKNYIGLQDDFDGGPLDEVALFIKEHLDELKKMFSPPELTKTVRELSDLKKVRAERLFGYKGRKYDF